MAVDAAVPSGPQFVHAFLDHVEANADTLVPTMVAEAGQPTMFADAVQLRSGLVFARDTIDLYLSMTHEDSNPVPVDELVTGRVALSVRRHEPVGVVTAITPYNAAIIMAFQKLIPALMAGNSVILRPSPLTPISSLIFGAAADAAGLPPGVLSVVVEDGADRRRAADHRSRGRHGLVHRLHRGRQADPRPGRADGEAGRARARRQVGADLPARRHRPRRRPGR